MNYEFATHKCHRSRSQSPPCLLRSRQTAQTGTPTLFDPAQQGTFSLDAPPSPWIDLGWITNFTRKSASKIAPLRTGAPAIVQTQIRSEVEATVSLDFESWGKLQLAVSSASEQMNLLVTATGTNPNGSGGTAAAAVPITLSGSSAMALNVGGAASTFNSVTSSP